ncbi:MAG TPA: FtsQ-type POTRA domain-containing protein [Pyrinomonadaceae bacterium]
MKNQLPAQKVGNRSGIGAKGRTASASQKPSRRDSSETLGSRMRTMLAYAPTVLKVMLAVAIGVVVFLGYRAAASASFFQVRKVEAAGINRASLSSIQSVVREDVKETGVWRADLTALSNHLQQLPWVRTAVVTRVLPDGIRVRIVEREPRAVVRTSAGRFVWVDEDAVMLEDMKPAESVPNFFLRGWNEDETPTGRKENRDRVAKFLELQRDWDAQGLSERVSEVSLLDLRDVRAQLAGDDSDIEIRLGSQDHGKRLRLALNELDKQRQTPRGPFISYLDLSQGKRAIIGLKTGSRSFSDSEADGARGNTVAPVERDRTEKPADRTKEKDAKARTPPKKNDQRRT